MHPYFKKMDDLGKPLKPAQIEKMAENRIQIEAVLQEVAAEVERSKTPDCRRGDT
jgi:glutaconyl-CoA decarboxylase